MRLALRQALLGLQAAVVVQCFPAEEITRRIELGQDDNIHSNTTRLLPRKDPTGRVRWTVHESCFNTGGLHNSLMGDTVIKAVNGAKQRSETAKTELQKWKKDCAGITIGENSAIKKQCQLLLGKGDWASKCDTAIKFHDAVSRIEGPIGANQGYANSDEWKALARDDTHHLNFVVYCAPDLQEVEVQGSKKWYDNGLLKVIGRDAGPGQSALLTMKEEYENKKFNAGQAITEAITSHCKSMERDAVDFSQGPDPPPIDRYKIASTITLHPLVIQGYLNSKNSGIMDDDQIHAWRELEASGKPPIDHFIGFQGLLHHEMFHTPGLGQLVDGDGSLKNYGWSNMVASQDLNLPDFHMYLALLVELTTKKIKVNEKGELGEWK